jgi:CrcB protein
MMLTIAIGGALGSIARYLLSESIVNLVKINYLVLTRFPWGTFVVNIIGSMLAGIVYFFIIKNFDNFNEQLKNFLMIGFFGGFTTFSAFCLDFFRLATAGQYLQAFIYIFSSVALAIMALFFGFYLTKIIFS